MGPGRNDHDELHVRDSCQPHVLGDQRRRQRVCPERARRQCRAAAYESRGSNNSFRWNETSGNGYATGTATISASASFGEQQPGRIEHGDAATPTASWCFLQRPTAGFAKCRRREPTDSAIEQRPDEQRRRRHLGSVGARQQQHLRRERVFDCRQRAMSGALNGRHPAEAGRLTTRIHGRLWAPLVVTAGVLCALQLARAESMPAAGAALRDLGGSCRAAIDVRA